MAPRPSIRPAPSYGTSSKPAPAQASGAPDAIHKRMNAGHKVATAAERPIHNGSIAKGFPANWAKSWPVAELALAIVTAAGLAYAWRASVRGDLTAGEGLGYYLGIAGSLMMLSLLLYPLRKYWSRLSSAGSVRHWFNLHVILGVAGPALVVAHSGYSLKSTNATVAMVVMLLVVASGIVGRYIYSRMLVSTSGKIAELSELMADVDTLHAALGAELLHAPEIEAELKAFEAHAKAFRDSKLGGMRATLFLGRRIKQCQSILKSEATAIISARALRERMSNADLKQHLAAVFEHLDAYFATVKKVTTLHFFERLFRLWHFLHLPLFLLLIQAALVHVVAVHLY